MKLKDWKVLRCNEIGQSIYYNCNEHTDKGMLVVYAPWNGDSFFEMDKEQIERDFGVSVSVVGEGKDKDYVLNKTCECGGMLEQLPINEWPVETLTEIIKNILEDENRHKLVDIPFALLNAMEDVHLERKKIREILLKMARHWNME